jgi:CxxC-x17-CxxC domain-containing protein
MYLLRLFNSHKHWMTRTQPTIQERSSMSFQEKSLLCSSCGTSFTFTAQEQERFASLGVIHEPMRCSWCRAARKIQLNEKANGSGNYGFSPQRQFFPATCAQCGRHTQVPFQPRGSKPVYCSDCYNKVRVSR